MTFFAFLFALGTAILKTIKFIVVKKTPEQISDWVLGWGSRYFSVPFLAIAAFFIGTNPVLNWEVAWTFLAITVLSTVSTYLAMRALRKNELSLASPFFATTPAFTVGTAWLFVGEVPTVLGFAGIVITVVGIYTLEIQKISSGFLKPVYTLTGTATFFLIIVVVVLRAFMQPILKIGVLHSSPLFFALAVQAGISITLTIIAQPKLNEITDISILYPAVLGGIGAASLVLTFLALEQALTAYVYSIQNTHIFFSVIAGWYIFNEDSITSRIMGGGVVFLGLILLLWGS